MSTYERLHKALVGTLSHVDWLGPLALRLYLVPVFWVAGMNKLANFGSTVEWFGNSDWGLGLPLPWLMAALATASEVGGAIFLLLGLAVRWVSIPLIVTMVVAISTIHIDHGWQALHDLQSPFASKWTLGIEAENAQEALDRLDRAKSILREHGNYGWLTEKGSLVSSNNGMEWAVTYIVMLLALVLAGGGRLSLDHWIHRRLGPPRAPKM